MALSVFFGGLRSSSAVVLGAFLRSTAFLGVPQSFQVLSAPMALFGSRFRRPLAFYAFFGSRLRCFSGFFCGVNRRSLAVNGLLRPSVYVHFSTLWRSSAVVFGALRLLNGVLRRSLAVSAVVLGAFRLSRGFFGGLRRSSLVLCQSYEVPFGVLWRSAAFDGRSFRCFPAF